MCEVPILSRLSSLVLPAKDSNQPQYQRRRNKDEAEWRAAAVYLDANSSDCRTHFKSQLTSAVSVIYFHSCSCSSAVIVTTVSTAE